MLFHSIEHEIFTENITHNKTKKNVRNQYIAQFYYTTNLILLILKKKTFWK